MDNGSKMEVLVFYSPTCQRCKKIHAVIEEAKKSIGSLATFRYMNCQMPYVRTMIAKRYGVNRIPSIVIRGDVYFVGVPNVEDLVGMVSYLYVHPEGGHGLEA